LAVVAMIAANVAGAVTASGGTAARLRAPGTVKFLADRAFV
jgi:hypothetical protein